MSGQDARVPGCPSVDHVVVLGAGMAGLVAARAASEHAERVTVVERDTVVGVTTPRRGVPQGRHVHGLLARGQQILDELFPGFTADAVEAGVPTGDLGELRWFFNGRRLQPAATGLTCVSADRPVLEDLVRRRVLALDGVRILERTVVDRLLLEGERVVGVEVRDLDAADAGAPGGAVRELRADVVVDCLGRGSRTPHWLDELGFGAPEEETVPIDLSYVTGHYRVTDEEVLRGDLSVNPVSSPSHPRGAFFSRVQGEGRCIVSLTGVRGDAAPTDRAGFEEWAGTIPVPDVAEILAAGTPLDEPTRFRFPHSVRRRYDRADRFPEGLLVMGDALCSFNPVYGQGMTVAALQSLVLRDLLADGVPDPGLFFARTADVVDSAWAASVGSDLAFWDDPLPAEMAEANAFMAAVHAAAARDPQVTRQFMRVAGLVDPPAELMTDDMAARIFGGAVTSATEPLTEGARR